MGFSAAAQQPPHDNHLCSPTTPPAFPPFPPSRLAFPQHPDREKRSQTQCSSAKPRCAAGGENTVPAGAWPLGLQAQPAGAQQRQRGNTNTAAAAPGGRGSTRALRGQPTAALVAATPPSTSSLSRRASWSSPVSGLASWQRQARVGRGVASLTPPLHLHCTAQAATTPCQPRRWLLLATRQHS